MNNADKSSKTKRSIKVQKNKINKGGKNGKSAAPKFRSISEEFYNGLIEQCIINGVTLTVIEKQKEKQK